MWQPYSNINILQVMLMKYLMMTMICMFTLMIVIGISWNAKDWKCTKTMKRMTMQVQLKNEDIGIVAINNIERTMLFQGEGEVRSQILHLELFEIKYLNTLHDYF